MANDGLFSINKQQLRGLLNALSGFVGCNDVMLALSCVNFDVEGETLTLSVYGGESKARIRVTLSHPVCGSRRAAAVSFKELAKFVKLESANEEVFDSFETFNIEFGETITPDSFRCLSMKFNSIDKACELGPHNRKLTLPSAGDWLEDFEIKEPQSTEFRESFPSAKRLIQAIEAVEAAAGKDECRINLCGVCIDFPLTGGFRFATTDGRIAAEAEIDPSKYKGEPVEYKRIFFPNKTAGALKKAFALAKSIEAELSETAKSVRIVKPRLKKNDKPEAIVQNPTQLSFNIPDGEMRVEIPGIKAIFPDTKQVFEKAIAAEHATWEVSAESFTALASEAAAIVGHGDEPVLLKFHGNELTASCQSLVLRGTSFCGKIQATKGENFGPPEEDEKSKEAWFLPVLLLRSLKNLSGTVLVRIADKRSVMLLEAKAEGMKICKAVLPYRKHDDE